MCLQEVKIYEYADAETDTSQQSNTFAFRCGVRLYNGPDEAKICTEHSNRGHDQHRVSIQSLKIKIVICHMECLLYIRVMLLNNEYIHVLRKRSQCHCWSIYLLFLLYAESKT